LGDLEETEYVTQAEEQVRKPKGAGAGRVAPSRSSQTKRPFWNERRNEATNRIVDFITDCVAEFLRGKPEKEEEKMGQGRVAETRRGSRRSDSRMHGDSLRRERRERRRPSDSDARQKRQERERNSSRSEDRRERRRER
jgi:hypothetical protein